MNRIIPVLGLALTIGIAGCGSQSATYGSNGAAKSTAMPKSTPSAYATAMPSGNSAMSQGGMMSIQLTNPMKPVTVAANGKIPVDVQIMGMKVAAGAVGKANVAGEGHYHFYVDCIPADAYTMADLGHCWAGAATGMMSTFDLTTSKVKITPGTHLLLVALAKNDHVLYRAPASSIVFTVK